MSRVSAPAPERGPPVPWGWAHIQHPDPAVPEIHLLPMSDTGVHAFDTGCACGAEEDAPGFIVHMAFDGRERYEDAGGCKMH